MIKLITVFMHLMSQVSCAFSQVRSFKKKQEELSISKISLGTHSETHGGPHCHPLPEVNMLSHGPVQL